LSYLLAFLRAEVAFAPVLAAQRGVALVAAEHDLFALFEHASTRNAGVPDGLFAAPAHGFHFLDGIRPGEQPLAALEQFAAEIRAQAIAHHGDAVVIHDFH